MDAMAAMEPDAKHEIFPLEDTGVHKNGCKYCLFSTRWIPSHEEEANGLDGLVNVVSSQNVRTVGTP